MALAPGLAHNRRGTALASVLVVLALGGCGLAIGAAPSGVELVVTSEFGGRLVRRSNDLRANAGETVLGLLAQFLPVRQNTPGGALSGEDANADTVVSVAGLSAGAMPGQSGQQRQWTYFVNGVRVGKPPARRDVHPGDHVWWDLHDTSQTGDVRAVVGSFPEPFLNGTEGKRLPVRVECASVSTAPCQTVTASLRRLGIPAAVAAIGSGGAPETLRVMVGPWVYLAGDLEAQSIAHGPAESGVYARLSPDGRKLTLLDQRGDAVRTLSGGAGLIAATTGPKEAPVWTITGTDEAGVRLAADALNAGALADHFAVAFAASGPIPLPVLSGGAGR